MPASTPEPAPLFDCNAHLGRVAQHQPSAYVDVPGLRATMGAHGLNQVLVYHDSAVRGDVDAANRRLLGMIAGEPTIHPCWVMLPPATREMTEPALLVREMISLGVRAVRLFPRLHGYQMRTRFLDELLQPLERQRVPVFVDYSIVHWADRFIDWDGIEEICQTYLDLPVVLVRPGLMLDRELYAMLEQNTNLYIETSYYFVHQGLRPLVERFGPTHTLFGTGMPAFAPGAAIAVLTFSGLPCAEQALIGSGNLHALLEEVLL
jgi:predicted TIM-barrel fold metal-dependent hydrolase